jgi:hypothetical protein
MKKFIVLEAVMLSLVFALTGCDTGTGGTTGGGDPFPITGRYTITVNGKACALEFKDDLTWAFTGYVNMDSANKSGTYSVSGTLITMKYSREGYATSDTFTASDNGDGKITLTSNGGGEVSVFLSSAFTLAAKTVELTVNDEDSPPEGPTQAEKNREIYNELFLGMWEEESVHYSSLDRGVRIVEFREDEFLWYYKSEGASNTIDRFTLDYEYLFSLPVSEQWGEPWGFIVNMVNNFETTFQEGYLCVYYNLPLYTSWKAYSVSFTSDGDMKFGWFFRRIYHQDSNSYGEGSSSTYNEIYKRVQSN